MTIVSLDTLHFPLHGSRLIEASAGTGKTFTIAALYLRLVLGHGAEGECFERPLLPPEILVVTFTEAATQELRGRIRQRLSEAAAAFRGLADADPLLHSLITSYAPEQHAACARKLELAAQWMDDAAVYTIHSWCQRMLRQHAFDSGSLFNLELDAEDKSLLAETIRDYWRLNFYPRDPHILQALEGFASTPEHLQKKLLGLLQAEADLLFDDTTPLAGDADLDTLLDQWQDWHQQARQTAAEAQSLWQDHQPELKELLTNAVTSKTLNNNSYKPAQLTEDLQVMAEWAAGFSTLDAKLADKYAQDKLRAKTAKGKTTPEHPAFIALQTLAEVHQRQPKLRHALLAHASHWVRQRFSREKQRVARLDFNDLLTRLDTALQRDGGDRLAEAIRQQFPIALIDEFQDTDPIQFRIFDAVYQIQSNRKDQGIFLIGDPKQAIYSFRGADIFTYLRARRATEGRHYTLERNYRSTRQLVEAVNRLFLQGESKASGAFGFKTEGENPVPFIEVSAKGRDEVFVVEGKPVTALQLWYQAPDGDAEKVGAEEYVSQQAAAAASEITRLLNLGQLGKAGFMSRGDRFRPLCAGDIAILVRGGRESQSIRQALATRSIKSVYLSDRDSVYASREAHDLLLWLKACAEPERDRRLRAALATATLDFDLLNLERLNRDELYWEQYVEYFSQLRLIWRSQGILPMLRTLLADMDLPARLLDQVDGERRLTNLLHLAELLASASQTLDGEQALIRHLAEHIANSDDEHKDHTIRLESDAGLVKVITIHKSKGLEYPLVFLPFICDFRAVDGRLDYFPYHGVDGDRRIDLGKSKAAQVLADAERRQEDLRLLYVALTRACHACWLGLAPLGKGKVKQHQLHHTAIGHLLLAGDAPIWNQLNDLAAQSSDISLSQLPDATAESWQSPPEAATPAAARAFHGRAAPRWWIASYTALKHEVGASQSGPLEDRVTDGPAAELLSEIADEPSLPQLSPIPGRAAMHRFPRGPQAGTFLHGLLEWAALEGFAKVSQSPALRTQTVAQRCHRRGWGHWTNAVDQWLQDQLTLPMRLDQSCGHDCRGSLADLPRPAYQPEMEFWIQATRVNTEAVDALVSRFILPGRPRPRLSPNQLNGMLKGFIDLVFCYQGRYFVADYKSNWLGAGADSYTREAMTSAILEKRYDLQYALYLLALHRLLRYRLPNYDYRQHVGGAAYLFLRGIDAPSQGLHLDTPPAALITALDTLFAGDNP